VVERLQCHVVGTARRHKETLTRKTAAKSVGRSMSPLRSTERRRPNGRPGENGLWFCELSEPSRGRPVALVNAVRRWGYANIARFLNRQRRPTLGLCNRVAERRPRFPKPFAPYRHADLLHAGQRNTLREGESRTLYGGHCPALSADLRWRQPPSLQLAFCRIRPALRYP
jgi:hypothetical protein